MKLTLASHTDKGLVFTGKTDSCKNGRAELLAVGPAENALTIFMDDEKRIHSRARPSQVLHGENHESKDARFRPIDGNVEHQKFTINADGTISLMS